MALRAPTTRFIEERIDYSGRELRSHWIYETMGIQGDAAVAFLGAADVRGDALIDLEDRTQGLFIAADEMLHFIIEVFGPDIDRAVMMQRLLVLLAAERLAASGVGVRRNGDDLFIGDGKLSVSIATVSAVSCLIHFAVNVRNDGTPVCTAALTDSGVDPRQFASELLEAFADELKSMDHASHKVRGAD